MLEPWTRDGRVRADVVTVAADVSGLVSDVMVHDNDKVTKGQPLFRIDQRRFQYALEQAKASVASRQVTLDQAKRDLNREQEFVQHRHHRAAGRAKPASRRCGASEPRRRQCVARRRQAQSRTLDHRGAGQRLRHQFRLAAGPLRQCRRQHPGAHRFRYIPRRRLFRGNQAPAHPRRRQRDREADRRSATSCPGMSRASPRASRTRTAAPAAIFWRRSIRPSAGSDWRSVSRFASSSTMCRRELLLVTGRTATVSIGKISWW